MGGRASLLGRGLYLNVAGLAEEGEELVQAAHGEALHERLVALEGEHDAENLFRLNRNVTPSPHLPDLRG